MDSSQPNVVPAIKLETKTIGKKYTRESMETNRTYLYNVTYVKVSYVIDTDQHPLNYQSPRTRIYDS